jgi:hypothetical protein
MITETKVLGLDNPDYRVVQTSPRKVPSDFPFQKPFLGSIIGQRGSGKTNALLSLIFHADRYKLFDKIYLFAPMAFGSEPKYDLIENKQGKHYELYKYHTFTDDIFKDVYDEIQDDINDYKEWYMKHKLYQRFLKNGLKGMNRDEVQNVLDMMIDEDTIQEPVCKWKHMPTSLLVFDDLVGNTDLYKPTPRGAFWSFSIHHRHLLSSCLFITQSYGSGAVPKQIRANLSLLMLFDLKKEIKKQVSDEMCGNMNEERFIELWEKACVNPYDFFMINFDAKKEHRFRKNFDTILSLI